MKKWIEWANLICFGVALLHILGVGIVFIVLMIEQMIAGRAGIATLISPIIILDCTALVFCSLMFKDMIKDIIKK
jgi:hypothetical protein